MACDVDAADSTTDAPLFAGQTRELSGIMGAQCALQAVVGLGPRRPRRAA